MSETTLENYLDSLVKFLSAEVFAFDAKGRGRRFFFSYRKTQMSLEITDFGS
jgi:hypothetical protein